jgi:enoyl-CoA hydratase/carnithine racemase
LMTGDFISGTRAAQLGIANRTVPEGHALDEAIGLARRIAAAPAVQVSMIKRMVRQAHDIDLRTHYDLVSSHFGVIGREGTTEDSPR